jgi:hypothetical protein
VHPRYKNAPICSLPEIQPQAAELPRLCVMPALAGNSDNFLFAKIQHYPYTRTVLAVTDKSHHPGNALCQRGVMQTHGDYRMDDGPYILGDPHQQLSLSGSQFPRAYIRTLSSVGQPFVLALILLRS